MSASSVRRDYAVVALGALGYTCLTFIWFSLAAYLPVIIDDVGLTGFEAGVLAGAVPLTYIPLSLVTGLVVDRVGPGPGIAAGLVVFGLAQVGRSLAPGFPSLLALTLLVGVGGTAITFGLPKLVSVLFPPERTGTPSSVYLVGASAGTAGAYAIGRPVLGPLVGGWRPLFLWSGLAVLGYAVAWLAVVLVLGVEETDEEAGAESADADEQGFTLDSLGRDVRAVVGHRELRLLVVVGTMYLLVIHGLQGWLPTLLESRGLAPTPAGRTTSLLVAANVVGILSVPPLADRLTARREAVMACGALACAGVAAIVGGGTGPLATAGIVGAGFGVGGISPLVRAIPAELDGIGATLTGAAVGLVFAVGEVGGFLGPVLVGTLRDATGSFAAGFGVLAAGGLVVVLAGAALDVRG